MLEQYEIGLNRFRNHSSRSICWILRLEILLLQHQIGSNKLDYEVIWPITSKIIGLNRISGRSFKPIY